MTTAGGGEVAGAAFVFGALRLVVLDDVVVEDVVAVVVVAFFCGAGGAGGGGGAAAVLVFEVLLVTALPVVVEPLDAGFAVLALGAGFDADSTYGSDQTGPKTMAVAAMKPTSACSHLTCVEDFLPRRGTACIRCTPLVSPIRCWRASRRLRKRSELRGSVPNRARLSALTRLAR